MNSTLLFFLAATTIVMLGCAGTPHRGGHELDTRAGLRFDVVRVGGEERKFAVYAPRDYTPAKPWPCIVFLNGSGECGDDGQRQLTQGLFPAIINAPDDWPFVALFPQLPTGTKQWIDADDLVMATLDAARRDYHLDESRLSLTGLSRGGAGTWAIAAKHPGLFAAIAPVCGYGEPETIAPGIGDTPVWAFHGTKDDVIHPSRTQAIIDAIARTTGRAPGVDRVADDAPLRVTMFPDLNHGCWDRAYRDMGLASWLLRWRSVR